MTPTLLDMVREAQDRCGTTDWFQNSLCKPARPGAYRVMIINAEDLYEIRWAWFDLAYGWCWPTTHLIKAASRRTLASPRVRIIRWQGLASDPNCSPVAEQQPNPG